MHAALRDADIDTAALQTVPLDRLYEITGPEHPLLEDRIKGLIDLIRTRQAPQSSTSAASEALPRAADLLDAGRRYWVGIATVLAVASAVRFLL